MIPSNGLHCCLHMVYIGMYREGSDHVVRLLCSAQEAGPVSMTRLRLIDLHNRLKLETQKIGGQNGI